MRLFGWALIKYDLCSFKKRKLGHIQVQRQNDTKTEREGRLQAKERDLKGDQRCQHLDPGLLASKTEGK